MGARDVGEAPAATALRASRDRLRSVSDGLAAFLSGSEEVFLETGSRLAEVEGQARALLDAARAAVALDAGSGCGDPAERLDGELGRLDAYLRTARDRSTTGLRRLRLLNERADAIVASYRTLETLPPTLRMLGMNTRIESSRVETRHAAMDTVAEEVRRIGERIGPKFQAVFEGASTLARRAGAARATAEAFLGRQGAWSDQVLREARAALGSLRALSAAETAVAARAVASSERLARDLGAVLVALQGHDATRQMLDHAVEALRAFHEGDASGEAAAAESLAHLPDVCRLASAQVAGARARLLGALGAMSGSLGAVAARGAELCRDAEGVAGGAGGSPAEQVIGAVAGASRVLRDHVDEDGRAAEAMRGVGETVRGLAGQVEEIQGIGATVKLIAMNALVKTTRAGEGGRVLAVLAQRMGELSAEVVHGTGEVSRTLREIAELAGALTGAAAAEEVSRGGAIAGALEALTATLRERSASLRRAVKDIHDRGARLGEAVAAIARRIAESEEGARRLEALERELARVGEGALPYAGAAGLAPRAASHAAAYARYTMDAERRIHERVLTGAERGERAAPGGASAGLGSNVELF